MNINNGLAPANNRGFLKILLEDFPNNFQFATLYGTAEIAPFAPTSSLTVQLVDRYSIGTILGFVSVSHQLGDALGSCIPGLLLTLPVHIALLLPFQLFYWLVAQFSFYGYLNRNLLYKIKKPPKEEI